MICFYCNNIIHWWENRFAAMDYSVYHKWCASAILTEWKSHQMYGDGKDGIVIISDIEDLVR